MEDSGSYFPQEHRHQLPPDSGLSGIAPDTSRLNTLGAVPLITFSGIQRQEPEPDDSCNRFYDSTHSLFSSPFAEKLSTGAPCNLGVWECPTKVTAPSQKRFLVFDQSGDRTTVMYNSGVRTLVHCGTCWMPKPAISMQLNSKEGFWDSMHPLRPILNDGHSKDNSRGIKEDKMQEDSEELDALLCADSDSYSSGDEATSTAHSPSTMTDTRLTEEEVDSSNLASKRRKLLDGSHDAPSQRFLDSSFKSHVSSGLEGYYADDRCGNEKDTECSGSSSGSKRRRKERIGATVSILKNVIPNAKGKDAIVVIDEAIQFLKSLKETKQ